MRYERQTHSKLRCTSRFAPTARPKLKMFGLALTARMHETQQSIQPIDQIYLNVFRVQKRCVSFALTWPEDTAAQLRVPIAPASTPICLYNRSEAATRAHTAAERMKVYVATFLAWLPRRTRRSKSRKPSSLGCGELAPSSLATGTSLGFFTLRFIAALTDNEMKAIAHAPSRSLPLGEQRQFCRVSLNMLTSAQNVLAPVHHSCRYCSSWGYNSFASPRL